MSLKRLACAIALLDFVSPPPRSQTPVDPALTIATLPNGLRYYLRANRTPAHRVELRLVVNAGSVLEAEDQRGYAHFLEHMAFDGTAHFPGHTLIDFVETSGMRYGADLNAHTTQDETVYTLTLPSDDPRTLERGLDVLQDWASGGITIDSAAVAAERGVVMGEWRTRLVDTASQAVQAHYDTLWLGGSRYLSRKPIGDTALIETATPGPIRRFYRDWYRPDLMTVVVVGDFDRAEMEREIRARFASIPAATTPRPRPQPTFAASAEPVIDVYRANVVPSVEMLWPTPAVPARATDAARQRLMHDLLAEWVSDRILRIRSHPSRPFITAQLEEGRLARPLNLHGFQLLAWPDSLERGLATVVTEIQRAARYGIPNARLAHQKSVLLARLEHAATSTEGGSSQAYADAYVDHALTGEGSLLSAQQELALAREILPTLNADTLAQAARTWLASAGARVLVGLPVVAGVRAPTRESVLALLDSIAHTRLAPDSDQTIAEQSPLLARLPTPGRIVNERHDRVAGITEWTLSNGARVILKPTQNDPDDVRIRAWSPGGFAAMPDSVFLTPGRMVGRVMTDIGGLGSMTRDALTEQLATTGLRSMRVDIGYLDESIEIAGSPKDLETLFQLVHLQFTAPMLDTAALAGWRSLAKYQGRPVPFDDEISRQLANGNARMLPVSTQVAELATVQNLMAAYRDRFDDAGTFTFTLVGAVGEREVRPLVERYVASIPATGARAPAKPPESQIVVHRGHLTLQSLELPKAVTLLLFDGRFPSAPQEYLGERQRLSALTGILNDRLRVRLRQELSGTYSPTVTSETYALPEERYRVRIVFDAAPDRMRELNRAMMDVLDSLRTSGVSDAEAERQATVQRRQLETRLQDNDYWVATIGTYARLGIPLDAIPAPYGTHAVTASEIQAAASKYLPNTAYIHITQMPEDTTTARSP